jgi:hypothetical protein
MSFLAVLRRYQQINALARSLIGRSAFDQIHVVLPDPAEPEPGFIRATSWLYCLYYEAGHVSIVFLRQLGEAYKLIDREAVLQHIEAVRCLRTELHHNLGFEDSDQQARTAAEQWKRKACGTAVPTTKQHWGQCYKKLVEEADSFLRSMEDLVRRLESDGDASSDNLREWARRMSRDWPGASFDPLIEDAARRLGRDALKTVAFRNRHIDRWRKQLELLEEGFDFEREATLLIEKALLDEGTCVLPVSGRDVIDALGLKPGPVVGLLLQEARRFFQSKPCSAPEILAHLREFHNRTPAAQSVSPQSGTPP